MGQAIVVRLKSEFEVTVTDHGSNVSVRCNCPDGASGNKKCEHWMSVVVGDRLATSTDELGALVDAQDLIERHLGNAGIIAALTAYRDDLIARDAPQQQIEAVEAEIARRLQSG